MDRIYVATKLFNINDRIASLQLCDKIDSWIESGKLTGFSKCFLPYRDSNEKVKGKENQTFEIFKMDCATVKESTLIIGYFDGPNYDSGIGFEIGFAYALGKPIILLSSDYFEIASGSNICKRNSMSALTTSIASIIHIRSFENEDDNYGQNLLSFRSELYKQLLILLESKQYKDDKQGKFNACNEPGINVFIDCCFVKTESGRSVLEQLIPHLHANGVTYHVATESDYEDGHKLLCKLDCADQILIYGDSCFDFGVDSTIIQGMAFALKKKCVLFSSEDMCLYQSDEFILHKNPMIEHSAKIVHSIKDIVIEII